MEIQNDHSKIFTQIFANFLYTQNEKKQSPHLKRAPIKYPKWKFLSQTDHSVIFNQLYSKLSLYSK